MAKTAHDPSMILKPGCYDGLNQQIVNEMHASLQYNAIASYFDSEGLPALAGHFNRQPTKSARTPSNSSNTSMTPVPAPSSGPSPTSATTSSLPRTPSNAPSKANSKSPPKSTIWSAPPPSKTTT
jgi:hypothetical protein